MPRELTLKALRRIELLQAIRDKKSYPKTCAKIVPLCRGGFVRIVAYKPDGYSAASVALTAAGASWLAFYEGEYAEQIAEFKQEGALA